MPRGNSYQYDAYAYDEYLQEQPKPKQQLEQAVEPKMSPAVKTMALCCLTIFISAFLYVNLTTYYLARQNYMNNLTTENQELKSIINETKANIALNLDLNTIEQKAIEDLDMRQPLPHQIIYIEINSESYIKYGK
ncbi:MAG: hypothetical protein BEN19_08485 [Epulopiscium sp. Nuni2H_MBin003]|nr:MAG: hypothetical protein BEN19_08485 [Epulopiscium sp. Nuni2H_MBin003]